MRLHINIDHVATLRNARDTPYPDPVEAARLCEAAGADGITAHLREDRRHIRDDDVVRLRAELTTLLNLEMAATDEMIAIAERVHPYAVSLVPEKREERTTEGGLDLIASRDRVEKTAVMCRRAGIKLSLFIEADAAQIRASRELGAAQIELHTGDYANADPAARQVELGRLAEGARLGRSLGLEVAAGHGLSTDNVRPIALIPEIEELNIGHAVICRAVLVGIEAAVRELRAEVLAGVRARS